MPSLHHFVTATPVLLVSGTVLSVQWARAVRIAGARPEYFRCGATGYARRAACLLPLHPCGHTAVFVNFRRTI